MELTFLKIWFLCVTSLLATSTRVNTQEMYIYATKTAYNMSLSQRERATIEDEGHILVPSFCRPIHVNAIFRHGTRDPGIDDIDSFYALNDTISGKIGNPSFSHLNSNWTPLWPRSSTDEKKLGPVGERENEDFGERFAKRYNSLLADAKIDEIVFYSSSKSRSYNSCKYFQIGYQNIHTGIDVINKTTIRDDLLRFFKNCKKYTRDVDKNKEAKKEYKAFLKGEEMVQVASNLSSTLQLADDLQLDVDSAIAAWMALAFEEAYTDGQSPWSGTFSLSELKIMEYYQDLKQWWKKSYAYPISYQQSCPLLVNTVKSMDKALKATVDNKSYTKALFQFGHSETVLSLVTLLGLYKDSFALKSSNYASQGVNRVFRTTQISPFATNVGMVLYKCDVHTQVSASDLAKKAPGVTWPDRFVSDMVQLLVKETPVSFPFTDNHLTSLAEIKQHYRHELVCDFDEICENAAVTPRNGLLTPLVCISFTIYLYLLHL